MLEAKAGGDEVAYKLMGLRRVGDYIGPHCVRSLLAVYGKQVRNHTYVHAAEVFIITIYIDSRWRCAAIGRVQQIVVFCAKYFCSSWLW